MRDIAEVKEPFAPPLCLGSTLVNFLPPSYIHSLTRNFFQVDLSLITNKEVIFFPCILTHFFFHVDLCI